jgi:hypothetical protein
MVLCACVRVYLYVYPTVLGQIRDISGPHTKTVLGDLLTRNPDLTIQTEKYKH